MHGVDVIALYTSVLPIKTGLGGGDVIFSFTFLGTIPLSKTKTEICQCHTNSPCHCIRLIQNRTLRCTAPSPYCTSPVIVSKNIEN